MTVVKICGLTRVADALGAVKAGADWLGLNFYAGSKRCVSVQVAEEIAGEVRVKSPDTKLVGVFVNASRAAIAEVEGMLDYVQFHGDETPEVVAEFGARAIKAFRIGSRAELALVDTFSCETILVDTPSADYGGSGKVGDWGFAKELVAAGKKLLLAGGLVPDNVAAAVAAVRPFGVDVASGVESSPGKKDRDKMKRFVDAVRGAK